MNRDVKIIEEEGGPNEMGINKKRAESLSKGETGWGRSGTG